MTIPEIRDADSHSQPGDADDPGDRRVELLLALLVLCATAFFVQPTTAQSASRLALTAAIAEEQTVSLDEYRDTLGVDFAEKDGEVFSDKAPGQPVAAVPLWLAYRAVGGEPGTELRVAGNLGLWWMTIWFSAVPAAFLVVQMRRFARRFSDSRSATVAALAMSLSTLLLPFGTLLFGHMLSGLLAITAFRSIRRLDDDPERSPARTMALAGVLTGAAVAVEYTTVLIALVLGTLVLFEHRRQIAWFALGGVGPGLFLAVYHWITFGGPLEHPYKYSAFDVHHSTFVGIGAPDAGTLTEVLIGDRGLLTLSPVIAIAIAGLVLARRRFPAPDVAVPLAVLVLYLVFSAGWIDATGGFSPGPRHILPAIPFLVGGVAVAYKRWPLVVGACGAFGFATMVLATVGDPQLPTNARPALRLWWYRITSDQGASTIFSPLIGDLGLLVVATLVTGAAWALRRQVRSLEGLSSPAGARPRVEQGDVDRLRQAP